MKRYYYNRYERSESKQNTDSKLPERKLLLAVLKRAVLDYVSADKSAAEDARAWFFGEAPTDEQFSFPWVAEQLDLNRAQIVQQIERLCRDRTSAALLGQELRG